MGGYSDSPVYVLSNFQNYINDIRTNIPNYSNYSYNDLYNMLPQELKDRIDTLLKHTESQSKKVISNFLKDKLSE